MVSWPSFRTTAIFVSFVLLLDSCSSERSTPTDSVTAQSATLASLRKVDDFPLYTMTYAGDYGFAEFLRTGIRPTLSMRVVGGSNEPAWGCTCFAALLNDSTRVFGRNFDWHDCIPLLLFTKPPGGYASASMVDLEYFGYSRSNLPDAPGNRERLLEAPFMPFDGMNEKGVAVGMMAVPEARAPYTSGKVTIGEIQVIRLVLDYAATLDEAINLIDRYNIRMEDPPIHYLITDRAGRSAVIEFVDGQKYVLRGTSRWQVSTNFIIHGSAAPEVTSCWRYNSAYTTLKQSAGVLTDTLALSLLQQVSQSGTVWSSLYKLESLRVLVVVGREFPRAREFALDVVR